ncbi:reverse transcriptase domain-containing protein [Tanacetum coccineum]
MIELEKIFPPAFFEIMIHVAIHLLDEAILAKPEGSIAEGYVAEKALTFCSRYLKDDAETRFNRLGRNDDGLPEEPDKFQVFRSICKSSGRMKENRLTTDVMQEVVWFVLNNSPEVDADILAYRDGVSTPGRDVEMYYGQLEEILELTYIGHRKVVLFRCKWSSEHVYHRDMAESDQDVIHGSSSSHVTLSVGLTCLEQTNLSIYAQSTEVDAPPVNDDNANANEDNVDFINNKDDVVAHVLDDDDVVVSDDDEVNPSTNIACVAPGSHGGDAGGSPPKRPNRHVPAQCQSSMLRLETGNASLRKAFREITKTLCSLALITPILVPSIL